MISRLTLNLLGGVTFLLDGQPVKRVPTRAAQALVVYLMHQAYPVERERLIDMFYQESTPKQAAANLRSTLSRLRKDYAPFLTITARTVGVTPGADIRIDSVQFVEHMQAGDVEAALALYQGDFLAGFYLRDAPEFEQWQMHEQERLRLLAIDGLQQLIDQHQQSGDFQKALFSAEKLLSIEPLIEQAHRQKMLLLARTGRRELALRHYKTVVSLMDTELGVPVSAETNAVYDNILTNRTADLAPESGQIPHNLPTPATPFIGRDAELAEIQQALADPTCRLLTLLGPGGIGKSRLALTAAHAELDDEARPFKDGVYFVPLVNITDADGLLTTITDTLGDDRQGRVSALDQLKQLIGDRQMLLVLDNFEQLVDCADVILDLLRACSQLKCLVTSRHHLDLLEVQVIEVGGLNAEEASKLFVGLAERRNRHFSAEKEAPHITAICRLTAGIPLALELAAVRTRHQACATIAHQIQESSDYLATQSPSWPPRQRTMRAVFNDSWRLLSTNEQMVLAQTAVFRGGFLAASFEQVTGCSAVEALSLMDKSLLQRRSDTRFDLHEIIREYAWEAVVDAQAIRSSHARHFLDRVNLIFNERGVTATERVDELRMDIDNIRAAWRWATQQALWCELKAAAMGMGQVLFVYELLHEGEMLFAETVRRVDESLTVSAENRTLNMLKAQLEYFLGRFLEASGDMAQALERLESSLQTAMRYEDGNLIARAGAALAYVLYRRGEYEVARKYAEQSLAISAEINNLAVQSAAWNALGSIAVAQGDYETAQHAYEQTLIFNAQNGVTNSYAVSLSNMGHYYNTIGDYAKASDYLDRSMAMYRQTNSRRGLALAGINLGVTAFYLGDIKRAQELLEFSYQLRREIGDQRGMVACLSNLANIATINGSFATAKSQLAEALTLAAELQAGRRLLTLYAFVANLHEAQQAWSEAVIMAAYVASHPGSAGATLQAIEPILAAAREHLSTAEFDRCTQQGDAMSAQTAHMLALAATA